MFDAKPMIKELADKLVGKRRHKHTRFPSDVETAEKGWRSCLVCVRAREDGLGGPGVRK